MSSMGQNRPKWENVRNRAVNLFSWVGMISNAFSYQSRPIHAALDARIQNQDLRGVFTSLYFAYKTLCLWCAKKGHARYLKIFKIAVLWIGQVPHMSAFQKNIIWRCFHQIPIRKINFFDKFLKKIRFRTTFRPPTVWVHCGHVMKLWYFGRGFHRLSNKKNRIKIRQKLAPSVANVYSV